MARCVLVLAALLGAGCTDPALGRLPSPDAAATELRKDVLVFAQLVDHSAYCPFTSTP